MASPLDSYVKRAQTASPRARGYRLPTAGETMRERCPFCDAAPGEPCRSRAGQGAIMAAFHAKRMRLASYIPGRG